MLNIISCVCWPSVCLLWRLLNFKPVFSFFSFTFIKRLFGSSLSSAMRAMSSEFLKLLMILPAIFWFHPVLHSAWHFTWCALHMKVKVVHSYLTLCDPGVGSLSLLQGIFSTQELNPGLPHYRWILYQLSQKGSPRILEWVAYPFSSRSFQPSNQTGVSCITGRFFTNWAMREASLCIEVNTNEIVWR